MKINTKERLRAMPMEDKVADEVIKRIELTISEAPSSIGDAQDLLAQLDRSLDAKIEEAFANGLAGDRQGYNGKWIAKKVIGIADCLAGKAQATEMVPAEKAIFEGQVAGMTTDVTIEAVEAGEIGNEILLVFNGLVDIDAAIAAWNLANPENTVVLTGGDGSQVPDNEEEIALGGGEDEIPADTSALDAAKATMGSDLMTADTKDGLDHAMADELAGDDFSQALAQAVQVVLAL